MNEKQFCRGLGLMISIGKWGNIYFANGWAKRICLGWISFTLFPCDGDVIIDMAAYHEKYHHAPAPQQDDTQP